MVYSIYFEAFKQTTLHGAILFDIPKRRIDRLTLPKTIITHLFHILLERLIVVSRQGRITPLFQGNLDMIPFKVIADDEIVGFCFLKRLNSRVFEVGLIGVLESKRGLGIGSQAIDLIKQYVKKMGANRLIVRASGIKQVAGFFTKCGFKQVFSEEVFFFDIA
jgi:GNAT superfamily N-acetyltransferase